ncbi:hypothetical protein KFK09_025923 [Dendrobium nobile]|uniref:Uncharacterized protein n=1 Tax=Dendrobium nobile TaxID=94219 RepID=A0A8T3A6F7_DENNO|nr:hypothetical protein KFK09_025923 [Dendrobium nobile]
MEEATPELAGTPLDTVVGVVEPCLVLLSSPHLLLPNFVDPPNISLLHPFPSELSSKCDISSSFPKNFTSQSSLVELLLVPFPLDSVNEIPIKSWLGLTIEIVGRVSDCISVSFLNISSTLPNHFSMDVNLHYMVENFSSTLDLICSIFLSNAFTFFAAQDSNKVF